MDYTQINSFLDKFKKLLSQGENGHTVIAETISKHLSYPIEGNLIKTKSVIIYITGSPMLRNEILMRKQAILSELHTLLPDRNFTDIR